MFPLPMPPWDMTRDVLVYAALPALLTAAVVMALSVRFGRVKQSPAGAAFGFAAGVVLGLWIRSASFDEWHVGPEDTFASALAVWLQTGLNLARGDSAWNRLPWAALGVLCVGRVARLPDLPLIDAWLLRAAASVTAAWLVIPAKLQDDIAWLMPAFALVVLIEWAVLETLAAQPPGGTVIFCLALAFSIASLVFLQASWASKAETAIVLAAALTGIAIVAAWGGVDGSGAVPVAALLLPGLMLMGKHQTASELPWQVFALTGCAPLALIATLPFCRSQSVWRRMLQLALVIAPLGGAVYLMWPIKFE